MTDTKQTLLRQLPGVDTVLSELQNNPVCRDIPHTVLVSASRQAVARRRASVLAGEDITAAHVAQIADTAADLARQAMKPNLNTVVNATGIVVHTNLGRSLLSKDAVNHLQKVATGYSNLEFDLTRGERGIRYACVEEILCELTGAEAAMVVNNNAGAVLLALDALAADREVVVSRGELIEIGGSFRIPDVMKKSGAILVETGTTNRTHLSDYETAITDDTALLLKVHTSNYSIVGFTAEVPLHDLVALGRKCNIPVMNDLGSGTLIDFQKYGLTAEPTVADAVASGTDIVTFSGDKLLGGPQSGIILGKKELIQTLRKNPLTRALRIDKLTLAALEMTLRAYRDEQQAIETIPTLNMITMPLATVEQRAKTLQAELKRIGDVMADVTILPLPSRPGGGSLPFLEIPSSCVGVRLNGISTSRIEEILRNNQPPVIGRIENDWFIMDMRTVADSEISVIKDAFVDIAVAL
ncbi:MAG: L-seryl-tRNA(Sec) selenium transferase [Thermodesulfobacteriota bacterium]|nr:L-seryl-tRNA(Sec) selenium transferase [Thermodesulfobacteriota bacterium]